MMRHFIFHNSPTRQITIAILYIYLVIAGGCNTYQHSSKSKGSLETGKIAIKGLVVTASGAKPGIVCISTGTITAVLETNALLPDDVKVVEYDGYIYPGLVDIHNHPQYNMLRPWPTTPTWKNRYEWQKNLDYSNAIEAPLKDLGTSNEYLAVKYGDVRAIIGGTTSMQGTFYSHELGVMVEPLSTNLGVFAWTPNVANANSRITEVLDEDLPSGKARACLFHVAEGVDEQSRAEFDIFEQRHWLKKGVVMIHCIPFGSHEFKQMADANVGMVWSPESNLSLYGKTADVELAIRCGVKVAIAPDWSVSGSENLLAEMKVGYAYAKSNNWVMVDPKRLFCMATSDAADLVGLGKQLGKVADGFEANIILAPKHGSDDPFMTLLNTYPKDIDLVLFKGAPVYGAQQWVAKIGSPEAGEEVQVGGVPKWLCTIGDVRLVPKANQSWADINKQLLEKLPNIKLAPLQ